jgi:DNA-binding GntR family transcriptional regulator
VATSHALQRRTTAETLAALLREEIQRGELRPGEKLRQTEMAARFAVSTTPIREAFALLQAQGFLRMDPHRGAVVFRPSAKDLVDSQEIRTALETLAVTKAVDNLDDETLGELQGLIDEMRQTRDGDTWVRLNQLFHLRLYTASGNDRLVEMITTLREASNAYIRMQVSYSPPDRGSNDQHQMILDACRAKDVVKARRIVAAHIKSTVTQLVDSLPDASDNRARGAQL